MIYNVGVIRVTAAFQRFEFGAYITYSTVHRVKNGQREECESIGTLEVG
jgi:hypothetical protein